MATQRYRVLSGKSDYESDHATSLRLFLRRMPHREVSGDEERSPLPDSTVVRSP